MMFSLSFEFQRRDIRAREWPDEKVMQANLVIQRGAEVIAPVGSWSSPPSLCLCFKLLWYNSYLLRAWVQTACFAECQSQIYLFFPAFSLPRRTALGQLFTEYCTSSG